MSVSSDLYTKYLEYLGEHDLASSEEVSEVFWDKEGLKQRLQEIEDAYVNLFSEITLAGENIRDDTTYIPSSNILAKLNIAKAKKATANIKTLASDIEEIINSVIKPEGREVFLRKKR